MEGREGRKEMKTNQKIKDKEERIEGGRERGREGGKEIEINYFLS
jgi:hypothetical protein